MTMTRNKPPPPRKRSWCSVREEPAPPSASAVSVRTRDGFRVVRTAWFVDVPSERATPAVVMPELPKQPARRPPAPSKAQGVKVWVAPSRTGFRLVSADTPRPVGARLMRLVADESDPEALDMLAPLASR